MTADNGYFLYYDASVLSPEDVQSDGHHAGKGCSVPAKKRL